MNRKLKIGYLNFWYHTNENEIIDFLRNKILYSIDFDIVDCTKEVADIVVISCFGNCNNWKGNPIILYYSGENPAVFDTQLKYDYSISFNQNSETNLYFPFFLNYAIDDFYNFQDLKYLDNKNKFCTVIVSNSKIGNLAERRYQVFDYVTLNYKQIDSIGPAFNNMNFILPRDMKESIEYHKNYKFNLCFENSTSTDTCRYITEKILNAYTYNTVPVYMGSTYVTDVFNQDSFINCNGLTNEQILEKIKEVDNNQSLYNDMIHTYPFKNKDLNYIDYRREILKSFVSKIVEKILK